MIKEIIIAYEGIAREYDNALLLKTEFEKRGYQVTLAYKSETFLFKKRNAIVILPNCYNTGNYDFYRYILNANGNVMISLQYEQVLSERIEKIGIHNPKGKAKDIWLFCWGNNCYTRLLQHGIDPEHLKICGAMQLDFLRPEFDMFYLDRKKVAERFQLDVNKRWLLYISSFSYVDNSVITKYTAKELSDEAFVRDFTELSVKSQKDTLDWFEKLIQENPDLTIIYRKHPVEAENVRLKALVQKYPEQFRDISDLSVKQWIKVSDIVTTWFSTSIAEVYMARRPLLLIRPHPIKREYDVPFYYGADSIDTYDKLKDAIDHIDQYNLPISTELLNEYYSQDEKPAFIRIADEVETIARQYGDTGEVQVDFDRKRRTFLLKDGKIFKYILKKVYQFLYIHLHFQIRNEKLRGEFCVSDWEKSVEHYADPINEKKYHLMRKIVDEWNKPI